MWNVEYKIWDVLSWALCAFKWHFVCFTKKKTHIFPFDRADRILYPEHNISFSTFHILLSTILLCFAQSTLAQTTSERFIWDQANTQMTHASNPEDYLESAKTYRRLVAEGIQNPDLLNNLGCALVMGGDYENSIKAFENAERFSGTTPETTEGIRAAICRRNQVVSSDLSWYRTAFFWHFRLPARMRIVTALSAWSLMWLGLLFYLLRKRYTHRFLNVFLPFAETFIITGALIFMLLGTSSLFSIIQDKHDEIYWQSVEFASLENEEVIR